MLGFYAYGVYYDPSIHIDKNSPEIVALKRKAVNEFDAFMAAVSANNPNLHTFTTASYDYCVNSPTSWGIHSSDPAHCYLGMTKIFGFDSDFMQTMQHLDACITSNGWQPESLTMQEALRGYNQATNSTVNPKKLVSDLTRPQYSNGDTTLELSWVERATIDKSHFDSSNIATEQMGGFLNVSGTFDTPSYNTSEIDDYNEYENYVEDYNQKRYLLVQDSTAKYPYVIAISVDKIYATKVRN